MTPWLLVALIVVSTALGDVLQSLEMRRVGEIQDFRPDKLGRLFAHLARRGYLILAIVFMGVSFFAFMKLLTIADLSFAVPATAASVVLETLLAKWILRERVGRLRLAGALLVAGGVAILRP